MPMVKKKERKKEVVRNPEKVEQNRVEEEVLEPIRRLFDKTFISKDDTPSTGYSSMILELLEGGSEVPPMISDVARGRVSKFLDGVVLKSESFSNPVSPTERELKERPFEVVKL